MKHFQSVPCSFINARCYGHLRPAKQIIIKIIVIIIIIIIIIITANRPDIIAKDSVNSTCKLSMTVPSDRNIALKEIEKKSKYKDLELEIQTMWHMKTIVIPVVAGALGTVKKGMVENIKKVSERATVTEIQKICMLGSARILRKVLSI